MAESSRPSVKEKTQNPFSERVMEEIDQISDGIGAYPEAFTETVAHALEGIRANVDFPDQIYFDINGKSYCYSNTLKESEGLVPIDAVAIKEEDRSLFMQVSRIASSSEDFMGEAELILGDDLYSGEMALSKIKEGFPEFYPPLSSKPR